MYLSNTVVDVDTRGRDFCRGCETVVASSTATERRR
jgi:predicted Zn-dependent protease